MTTTKRTGAPARVRVSEPVRIEQSPPSETTTFVGVGAPRLSWKIASAPRGWRQQAVQLELRDNLGHVCVESIQGAEQVLVAWPFAVLSSRERASIRIRVSDGVAWGEWSPPALVEASLLSRSDWSARWISPISGAHQEDPAPIVGTSFTADRGLTAARLHYTALGIVEPHINGVPVSPDLFTPGWTSYDKQIRFRTYDVTDLVRPGVNELDALIGNGWYRGRISSQAIHRGRPYGERLGLLAQLELEYEDGTRATTGTDERWATGSSRVIVNDFYDGQTTDLRLPKWPELNQPVDVLTPNAVALDLATMPPVRALRKVPVVESRVVGSRTILDFGENISGWLRATVAGERGTTVTIRHAEVLEEGALSIGPLRSAKATDRFILDGGAEEVLEPSLTYHGFRFAEIDGIPPSSIVEVEAVVIGSALTRTGWFETSNAELQQLHDNVVRSATGNFVDIPTDCPQRDERLGWTADIQVFAPTASVLFDVGDFLDSWLDTLRRDQYPDGRVPPTIPSVLDDPRTIAGWGDAAVVVPWVLFARYGDRDRLLRQYPSMVAWVEREQSQAGDSFLWRGGDQNGDWLDPLAPPNDPRRAQADPDVLATACFYHSVDLLAGVAAELGLSDDESRFARLRDDIASAFASAYVSDEGRIASDCQTVYAVAIEWSILRGDEANRLAAAHLVSLVERQNFTIATGFIGTPLILHALTRIGRPDIAYRMLTSHAFPGWLYAIDLGATTLWERWDSLLADGSVNPGDMTSFNHYAFGSVADWMHSAIAGFESLSPGCRTIRIQPEALIDPGGVNFRYDSPYGPIISSWRVADDLFAIELSIPVGVVANVILPDGTQVTVEHGEHSFSAIG